MPTSLGSFSAFIRDDFSLSTWLLLGASIQTFLVLLLPRNVALLPAVLILATRIVQQTLAANGLIHDPVGAKVIRARKTAQIPNDDGSLPQKPADKDMVVFFIGSRGNGALGRFAPGFRKMGDYFQKMWDEVEEDRESNGFLGRTATLISTEEASGNTIGVLSYWKDMDSLHAFAHGKLHREGWDWYTAAVKKDDNLAIFHEVYSVPAGRYENIYQNMAPLGMGQVGVVPQDGESKGMVSALVDTKGSRWKSMYARMGRD